MVPVLLVFFFFFVWVYSAYRPTDGYLKMVHPGPLVAQAGLFYVMPVYKQHHSETTSPSFMKLVGN